MSTVHLIIGQSKDAERMSRGSLKEWPNLAIDPIDDVSLAKLLVLITGDDYNAIIDSFTNQIPEQPDVEPWEIDKLLFPVCLIPRKYVRALATMKDEHLPALAQQWSAIEEFKWYKFEPSN